MSVMRVVARPLLIGFVLMILFWFTMTMLVGISLARRTSDGVSSVSVAGLEFASGEQNGPQRRAGLKPAGFALALVLFVGPPALVLGARRRKDAP